MKFKILFQNIFYPTLKIHNFFSCEHRVYILKGFKSHIEKNKFFSCEHRVYILKDFKSHIKKIKYSSSIYIVNFEKSL